MLRRHPSLVDPNVGMVGWTQVTTGFVRHEWRFIDKQMRLSYPIKFFHFYDLNESKHRDLAVSN